MPKQIDSDELEGGSAGEMERGMSLPFFYPGVKAVKFLEKNVYGCRILPAFDKARKGQPGWETSFVPYRRTDEVDPNNGYGTFTSWFYPVPVYQFFGSEKRGFVSPLAKEKKMIRGRDPVYDCWLTARNSDNADWKAYTEKGKTKEEGFNADLPAPKMMGFLNVYMAAKEGEEQFNFIGVVNFAAIVELKALLNMLRPAVVQEIVSPAWPDFLYGDVTDPLTGLWSYVKTQVFNTAGMKTPCFTFSQQKDVLRGHQVWSIDPTQEWGMKVLAGRYNIGDMNKVTKIPSAQEILSWLVEDEFLPYALVEKACKEHWAVPPPPGSPEHSFATGPGVQDGGAFENETEATADAVAPAPSPGGPLPAPGGIAKSVYKPPTSGGTPSVPVMSPGAPPPPRAGGGPSAPRAAGPGAAPPPPRVAGPGGPPPAGGRAGVSGALASRPSAPGGPPPLPQGRSQAAPPPAAVTAQPVQEAAAVDTSKPALTEEEWKEWKSIEDRMVTDPNSVTGPEVQRMMLLGDRAAVNGQNG